MFSNFINILTVISNQFGASLMNKSIIFFRKELTGPKPLNSSVYNFINFITMYFFNHSQHA